MGVNLIIIVSFLMVEEFDIKGLMYFLLVFKLCFFVFCLVFYIDLLFFWFNVEEEDNLSCYNFIVMLGFVVY